MRWDLFLGCLPHTITDLELASKLINMCDYYQTATGPAIRDLVFPGLEVLGQSNSFNMLYRATLPDSRVTSGLPGHRATSQQQDQMLAGICVY